MNDQNKTNDDLNSNSNIDLGMQLLHDVTQSISDQVVSAKEVVASNETLTEKLSVIEYSISQFNKMVLQQFHIIEQEQENRKNFLSSIPRTVKMEWNNESAQELAELNTTLVAFKKLDLIKLGALALCLLVITFSCYFSLKFYEKSVQSKSEIREEIITEIYDQGKGIYDVSEYDKLKSNTVLIQQWIERNPRDSKPFLRFKDASQNN